MCGIRDIIVLKFVSYKIIEGNRLRNYNIHHILLIYIITVFILYHYKRCFLLQSTENFSNIQDCSRHPVLLLYSFTVEFVSVTVTIYIRRHMLSSPQNETRYSDILSSLRILYILSIFIKQAIVNNSLSCSC
jgi:hypothetical protein